MIRFDDDSRTLTLSVRDLVESGPRVGHLVLQAPTSGRARMAAGQRAHVALQTERSAEDAAYRAEVTLSQQIVVHDWTVTLQGRVDGLTEVDGRSVVEEIKTTGWPGHRLVTTSVDDWRHHVRQLEVYLWMLARSLYPDPVGRLVMVSVSDQSRHTLAVPREQERIGAYVMGQLEGLVTQREHRLAWLDRRRRWAVPEPFDAWRLGQPRLLSAVQEGLAAGKQVLLEAPTGLGKTAAVLVGALRHALATDKQVFWATFRSTHQVAAEDAVDRLRQRGLPLTSVTLGAKEKVCLNDEVVCRPDTCRFAANHYDKLREHHVVEQALESGVAGLAQLEALAREHVCCPYALAHDAADRADVVIGDINYALAPQTRLERYFGEEAGSWVLCVDEAHHLVERARTWRSPRIALGPARHAAGEQHGPLFSRDPFAELAAEVAGEIEDTLAEAGPMGKDGLGPTHLARRRWRDLAARFDELALDYVLRLVDTGRPGQVDDPWVSTARGVQRIAGALEVQDDALVHVAQLRRDQEQVGLLCLDPSSFLGPRLEALGGFVALSATLSPPAFYRDLWGLTMGGLDVVRLPSPFPPENRAVVVAPRVSTRFADRERDAGPTARLVSEVIAATPGNVAVYFPSFAMLREQVERWQVDRELLVQEPAMAEDQRRRWLERLRGGGEPVVLAAVLGGLFAEGVDLPHGALSTVVICGPALPPIGFERDLLRAHYEQRFGDGFAYASLIPGMTRVIQAAGRVVRTPEDRGVVVLVGRRFRWRSHAELFPPDWDVTVAERPEEEVAAFWQD